MRRSFLFALAIASLVAAPVAVAGQTPPSSAPKRLLLIGGPYDHHPKGTHEYMSGMRIVSKCLADVDGLQIIVTNSERAWSDGPAMIADADGIVLFREQGARWMQKDPDRLAALEDLGRRGGGCVALHFGMGTVDARYIDRFVALFGGCHGGPDRKHDTLSVKALVADRRHPICLGINDFEVHDEFYYQLKFVKPAGTVAPLIQAKIEGRLETVSWAWEREDGGRSFGFSGLHYHRNWQLKEYRRLVSHAILWTLKLPVPEGGVDVELPDEILELE